MEGRCGEDLADGHLPGCRAAPAAMVRNEAEESVPCFHLANCRKVGRERSGWRTGSATSSSSIGANLNQQIRFQIPNGLLQRKSICGVLLNTNPEPFGMSKDCQIFVHQIVSVQDLGAIFTNYLMQIIIFLRNFKCMKLLIRLHMKT